MPKPSERISQLIKDTAKVIGFDNCGIVETGRLEKESSLFRQWLENGNHAGMAYMARNVGKRLDPRLLNEWARSIILLTYNYYPANDRLSQGKYKISRYAYGRDYHDVIRNKLRELVEVIEDEIGEVLHRVFVDSAPVMEKAWAARSGLGWIGKNSCLINQEKGSFYFIGCILTNLDLSYDEAEVKDHCGKCTRCIDACPNTAITSPGIINANKCISYLTIEHKGAFKADMDPSLHNWIFGCDICQEVCPYNRFSIPHNERQFLPSTELLNMTETDWESLDEPCFVRLFKETAVERTGYAGLRRNIEHQ